MFGGQQPSLQTVLLHTNRIPATAFGDFDQIGAVADAQRDAVVGLEALDLQLLTLDLDPIAVTAERGHGDLVDRVEQVSLASLFTIVMAGLWFHMDNQEGSRFKESLGVAVLCAHALALSYGGFSYVYCYLVGKVTPNGGTMVVAGKKQEPSEGDILNHFQSSKFALIGVRAALSVIKGLGIAEWQTNGIDVKKEA